MRSMCESAIKILTIMADWERYFDSEIPPTNLEETRKTIFTFAAGHVQNSRNIVYITSGGTSVPLEANTVRFIDNFSSGSRGAASAEYFLSQGYAVIFVYRQNSALPFQRHFTSHNPLEFLTLHDLHDHVENPLLKNITVDESKIPILRGILTQYKEVKRNGCLLQIEFSTLSSYLFLLRMSAVTLASFGQRVMFYLAAAVSDFYIPRDNLSTHKLQSNQGPLVLNLQQTPKLLQPLVKEWSPRAFVVSFKLETDVNIISKKARESLSKNSHQVVISNILQTRRKTVVIVTASAENAIWMSDSELEKGKDIEEKIVADLVKKHNDFITQNSLSEFNSGTDIVLDKNFPVSSTSGQVIYLSEGTHYQLQNRVGENSIGTSTVLLSQNDTHQFTVPSSFTYKRPGGVLTSTASLHPDNSDVINYTSKFKFSNDNTALSEEMKEFIEMFKNKRMTLGYTQEDVGLELSGSSGPCYSQSFISRFESKQLAAKASEKMKPLLQAWLDAKDADQVTGVRLCKKRRRRTSFTSDSLAILIDHYKRNPKPNPSEISAIASQLNIEPVTVKVWFCNRKQSERRRSLGKSSGGETLKAELEANITNKGKIDPSTEQANSYSLGRLQPLISEQTPVTVLDATVVQFQPGATIATHEDTSTSRSYCATPVTVINTDPHIMQYSATAEGDSTTNTHSFTTPIAVMETEVPTSDRASSTTAVQ